MRLDTGDAGLQLSSAEAQHSLAEADAKRYRELRARALSARRRWMPEKLRSRLPPPRPGWRATSRLHHIACRPRGRDRRNPGGVRAGGQCRQAVLRLAPNGEHEAAIAIPESQLSNLKTGDAAEIILLAAGAAPLAGYLRELSPAADPASRTYAARVSLTQPSPDAALGMTVRCASLRIKKVTAC